MIDNPDGYKVPVSQAASYSKYLGEFTVTFDDNGVVKEAKGDPIFARQVDRRRMPLCWRASRNSARRSKN